MRRKESFALRTDRFGPLPIVNHFLERLGLEELLEQFVPTKDSRLRLSHAKALGVLLRSIIVEREPIYRQQETVAGFAPNLFSIEPNEIAHLTDDRIGRGLDNLYDADRGALLTAVVLRLSERFSVRFDELHNDSTTIRFCGQYRQARGRTIRGKQAPWITNGCSKDRRPDLKQLLFILTSTADGGIPVQFRCENGNTEDSTTHIQTWETLRRVTGRNDALYVADSKLCNRDAMGYIDEHGGRFVTVLPRSRLEDKEFRRWIQTHEPDWELVWNRPNPRKKHGLRDRWWVHVYHLPSSEGWPVIWVRSSLLKIRQEQRRRENIARAVDQLEKLNRKLASGRSRLRKVSEIDLRVEKILARLRVKNYVRVERIVKEEHQFRQKGPGRPSPKTEYRRFTRRLHQLQWEIDERVIAYDQKSDGMYPLLTNDRALSARQVLEAHKGQPVLEKRFQQLKSVHEIAPVFLKNEARIEALFFLYFLALIVQGLIERELRQAMKRERVKELPIYPEERQCKRPTTEQVLKLFSHAMRNVLLDKDGGKILQVFETNMTPLQEQILELLGVPQGAFRPPL